MGILLGDVHDLTGVAAEVTGNRRHSLIGVPQRHYSLDPVLITPDGVCGGVVVIAGSRATYVYASNGDGDIADYSCPVATAPGGTSGHVVLAAMGYRVAS